ncbi:MAG: hypothetical protein A2365_02625 [Candidatus Nealsonbacteria bacterium RIFOXYB1_FULL_40_15]|uniref:Translation elongation factor-like protein n=2 Tax=Candidatus Nealsoniibacteriota TaxID=1817911 RepID=A0A1G2ENX5_9BACT|nr:MAG: hypothetical protein A2365_02625 [Candidatus Nealsonbacteria bacterium RIFOXYB1_FULL_40_15]OGZ27496.1 MAG: hypothetical protein A2427_01480 [Candidatus Nealsonbacteria bacterium RIFOXYC1_FULL_40_7]OGZ28151.1 MAG: hypothetical protein A2562_02885 [Candidatus Nealsonbacteria bacterium RIFOXYD1_FULL_39_11]
MIKKEKPIGKVTHYFGKIKVAVVKLSAPLSVGEKIRVSGGQETDFRQTVKSIEYDHKKLVRAGKGKAIGLKMAKKVREGFKLFKLK